MTETLILILYVFVIPLEFLMYIFLDSYVGCLLDNIILVIQYNRLYGFFYFLN